MTATASEATGRAGLVEFIRYFACSALALGVDASLYWLCLRLGMAYQGAAVAGFVGGVSTAYILSVRWAFSKRSITNPQVEFLIFLGVGVAGLGLTEALLWLQIGVFGMGPLASKLVAAMGVFLFNFATRKALLFTRRAARAVAVAA